MSLTKTKVIKIGAQIELKEHMIYVLNGHNNEMSKNLLHAYNIILVMLFVEVSYFLNNIFLVRLNDIFDKILLHNQQKQLRATAVPKIVWKYHKIKFGCIVRVSFVDSF